MHPPSKGQAINFNYELLPVFRSGSWSTSWNHETDPVWIWVAHKKSTKIIRISYYFRNKSLLVLSLIFWLKELKKEVGIFFNFRSGPIHSRIRILFSPIRIRIQIKIIRINNTGYYLGLPEWGRSWSPCTWWGSSFSQAFSSTRVIPKRVNKRKPRTRG